MQPRKLCLLKSMILLSISLSVNASSFCRFVMPHLVDTKQKATYQGQPAKFLMQMQRGSRLQFFPDLYMDWHLPSNVTLEKVSGSCELGDFSSPGPAKLVMPEFSSCYFNYVVHHDETGLYNVPANEFTLYISMNDDVPMMGCDSTSIDGLSIMVLPSQ